MVFHDHRILKISEKGAVSKDEHTYALSKFFAIAEVLRSFKLSGIKR